MPANQSVPGRLASILLHYSPQLKLDFTLSGCTERLLHVCVTASILSCLGRLKCLFSGPLRQRCGTLALGHKGIINTFQKNWYHTALFVVIRTKVSYQLKETPRQVWGRNLEPQLPGRTTRTTAAQGDLTGRARRGCACLAGPGPGCIPGPPKPEGPVATLLF